MSSQNYTILLFPKTLDKHHLSDLARKLRDYKLHALAVDPKAFSLEYSSEASLPISTWESRIVNRSTQIIICIPAQDTSAASEQLYGEERIKFLLNNEWVGIFTMVYSPARDAWIFPESQQPTPGADDEETRWHLTSLFILPSHRGKGLAKKITLAAIQFGTDLPHGPLLSPTDALEAESLSHSNTHHTSKHATQPARKRTTRFRLVVHPDNKQVVHMYLKLGFVDCARYTLREAYLANGDGEYIPVPADTDAAKWDLRAGIGMEYLVQGE